ncbi:cysteine protease StiP family protein [Sutcliffiella halmapala]
MDATLFKMGSYPEEDVTFLLKDLSNVKIERSTIERESAIQKGVHYSEMLPIEYKPSQQYINLFSTSLEETKEKIALYVAIVAEQIISEKGFNIVLSSLARAGTPIGVLIKRYIQFRYHRVVPHYSISIVRDRGIDENALHFILANHKDKKIVFVDGWTGKGAIKKQLDFSIKVFNEKYNQEISSELAVLADPGYCSSLYGTRDDFLIPSACLNSTVSGLVSRTVLNRSLIGSSDFHGAKFYKELLSEDLSNFYVDTISSQFSAISSLVQQELENIKNEHIAPDWRGLISIQSIQDDYKISNTHYIKPGVGETTRVLLRRVPWKILINTSEKSNLGHILMLAKERGVPVVEYNNMSYSCCGLIKQMENKDESVR